MINFSQDQLRRILEKDGDVKRTVSFNYPKYEEIGTPHPFWLRTVDNAEEDLEQIIADQPFREDFPLTYYRREEQDASGRVIKVHLDLLGRKTMVDLALQIFAGAEQNYVLANQIATKEGMVKFQELIDSNPQLKDLVEKSNLLEKLGLTKLLPTNPLNESEKLTEELQQPEQNEVKAKKEIPFFIMPNPSPNEFH